jgi:hypothetical protein
MKKNNEEKLKKLEDFAKTFAACPCCYELRKCKKNCEFEDGGFENMDEARKALFS